MSDQQGNPAYSEGTATYLDLQAAVGISKHFGGLSATDELYQRCHLAEAREVLDVGCGIGIGPATIAKRYPCRVTAVDLSAKMLSWARRRARREGVAERIEFHQADIRELPLGDNRYDAVIVESVMAFVPNKAAVIRELLRVTRPGGYVGLNESWWVEPLPPGLAAEAQYVGTHIITEAEWRELWAAAPLSERLIQARSVGARQEVRDRIAWLGCRTILAAQLRALVLALTNREARQNLKRQVQINDEMAKRMGYGLLVGRKPL